MDIAHDHFAISYQGEPSAADPVAPLDWPGLQARLAAAHVARWALSTPPRARAAIPGSFAPAVAHALAKALATSAEQPSAAFHHPALTQTLKPVASPHGR